MRWQKWALVALVCLLAFSKSGLSQEKGFDPLFTQKGAPQAFLPAALSCVGPEETIDLWEAVRQALCTHPATRQSFAFALAQAARLGEARSEFLPQVNASASKEARRTTSSGGFSLFGQGQSLARYFPGIKLPGGERIDSENQGIANVALNYLLFDFGRRKSQSQAAREALAAANWSHDAQTQGVILEAVQNYARAAQGEVLRQAQEKNLASAEEIFASARLRHETGQVSLTDVLQAQTARAQALLALSRAREEESVSQGELASTMGMDIASYLRLAPILPPQAPQIQETFEALVAEALSHRPDLAELDAQDRQRQAEIQVARRSRLPRFDLSSGWGALESSPDPRFRSRQGWVGMNLTWPIFTGFAAHYRIREASALREEGQAQRQGLLRQIERDAWRGYHDLLTAKENLGTTEVLLESATHNEKAAMARYMAGLGSILDVLSAQAALAQARAERIQAISDWLLARASLAFAIGGLTPESAQGLEEQ